MNSYKNQYISILGDSVSTFEGWLPQGQPSFYSRRSRMETGIYGPEETWWGRVLAYFDAKLLVNNSWSGSFVCRAPRCQVESCGCSDGRTGSLGDGDLTPDHIFVFMGANDAGSGFPVTGGPAGDPSFFDNAYGLMLRKLRIYYPGAVIWCLTFPCKTRKGEADRLPQEAYVSRIRQAAESSGCRLIELGEVRCDTQDGLHPNYEGMKAIAQRVIEVMEG